MEHLKMSSEETNMVWGNSITHHMATTLACGQKLTITLSSGTPIAGTLDLIFTDGLSLIGPSDIRLYLPIYSIAGIRVNP
jgi:hypothetical protein